jgi:hypothetical protein
MSGSMAPASVALAAVLLAAGHVTRGGLGSAVYQLARSTADRVRYRLAVT